MPADSQLTTLVRPTLCLDRRLAGLGAAREDGGPAVAAGSVTHNPQTAVTSGRQTDQIIRRRLQTDRQQP